MCPCVGGCSHAIMCVPLCPCVCVSLSGSVFPCVHVPLSGSVLPRVHVCSQVCTCVPMCVPLCPRVCVCVPRWDCVPTCACVFPYIPMCACVFPCVHVSLCGSVLPCDHVCSHVYMCPCVELCSHMCVPLHPRVCMCVHRHGYTCPREPREMRKQWPALTQGPGSHCTHVQRSLTSVCLKPCRELLSCSLWVQWVILTRSQGASVIRKTTTRGVFPERD